MEVNRLNSVEKATNLKKHQKWEQMKWSVIIKTATDQ